ncbi:MAG: helix-turn-helix domain-containing protein [Streptosporangiaceae bacterium]
MACPPPGGVRREEVRLQAAEWFAEGVTPPQVARRLRVSSNSAKYSSATVRSRRHRRSSLRRRRAARRRRPRCGCRASGRAPRRAVRWRAGTVRRSGPDRRGCRAGGDVRPRGRR